MNNEKGITLTSLIIYILGMMVVIATIATITTFFYKNVDVNSIKGDSLNQFSNFTSVFVSEVEKKDNQVIETALVLVEGDSKHKCKTKKEISEGLENIKGGIASDITSYIVFSSGNQYTFKNKSIYKNKIRICTNVDLCVFSTSDTGNQVTVNFKTADIDKTADNAITYTLK